MQTRVQGIYSIKDLTWRIEYKDQKNIFLQFKNVFEYFTFVAWANQGQFISIASFKHKGKSNNLTRGKISIRSKRKLEQNEL